MKNIDAKNKNIKYAVFGTLLVALLVLSALFSPIAVMDYADHQTERHLSDFKMEVKTYTKKYSTFAEEVKAMINESAWRDSLQFVGIAESRKSSSDEELTQVINQELNTLNNLGILVYPVMLTAAQLQSRKLFDLYSENEENILNGIHFWKLTYKVDNKTVDITVDAGFHVICQYKIVYHDIKPCEIFSEYHVHDTYSIKNDIPMFKSWWSEKLTSYFGLHNSDSYCVARDKKDIAKRYVNYEKNMDKDGSLAKEYGYDDPNILMMYYDATARENDTMSLEFGIWNLYQFLQ